MMNAVRCIFAVVVGAWFCAGAYGAAIINDTEIERHLTELVEPLADAAGIAAGRLKINVVHSDDFNAFVSGGEEVYIYTGLLTQIKTPDALQAVVAHELGHTLGGHMAQMSARMNAELKRTAIVQALGVGLMVAGGNPSLGMGVLAGTAGMTTQSMLAFSRDEERMADNLGLDLMMRAGQNPNGFVDVFEQMRDITGAAEEKINPNRVNHPLTTERLKNVRDYIAARPSDYKSDARRDANRRAQYELVRAKLVGYLYPGERVRTLYPTTDKSDAALYARAIANMRAGNLAGAKTGTQTLISRHGQNPYFYELLGDIEYQYGHYDDSVAAYDKSLTLAGGAPQIQTALALVLSERDKPGDRDRAIELCRRALLAEPAALTYWVLARAWGDGDGRADWAMAEYYNMTGDQKKTHQYATRARKRLDKSAPEYIKSTELLRKD